MFQNINFLVQSGTVKSSKSHFGFEVGTITSKIYNKTNNQKKNVPYGTLKNENFLHPTSNWKRLDSWFHLLHTQVWKLSLLYVQ